MYGLKQAPRAWFHRLSSRLLELGFTGSKSDSSLFIFKTASITILALVYVDDIIFTRSNSAAILSLIQALSLSFLIKDLGELNFFSWHICDSGSSKFSHLSQHRYISDILARTNMTNAKPISSPMATNSSLSKFSGMKFFDGTLYRSIVGAL